MPTALSTLILSLALLLSTVAGAQVTDEKVGAPPAAEPFDNEDAQVVGEGGAEVEALYDRHDEQQAQKREASKKAREQTKRQELKEASTLSDLANLAPFADVAVIQRRFLPRTGRFEMSGNFMSSINNPFYNNLGFGARSAYFLRERHGIELMYLFFSNTRRAVTRNLDEQRDVRTTNLVTPKSFMGAAYKWVPFYGKITFLNRHIVPFDLYFNAGLGLSQTDKKGEPTINLGTGQSFALSKSLAVRWDLVWNSYQATADSATGTGEIKTSHNDIFLSIGVSFFFPEATYR